jgi:hypothetical protein
MKNWITELGKMPDFDGSYLVLIYEKKECGNIWKFQAVMTCAMNCWFLLLDKQTVMAWKELDENPLLPKETDCKHENMQMKSSGIWKCKCGYSHF